MPNGKAHAVIGIGTGAVGSLCVMHKNLTGLEMTVVAAGGAVGGYLGAKLPDILEPATNPNHRQFGHSFVFNGTMTVAGYAGAKTLDFQIKAWTEQIKHKISETQDPTTRLIWAALLFLVLFSGGFVVGLFAGYLSHVAADSMTPASIPVLGSI